MFGREDRGLTNEELHLCHYHVSIPSDEEYGVLNVASAVQVIAYEVRMAHLMAEKGVVAQKTMHLAHAPWDEDIVPVSDMEQFFTHFEAALVESGFLDPNNPRQMPARVRRCLLPGMRQRRFCWLGPGCCWHRIPRLRPGCRQS